MTFLLFCVWYRNWFGGFYLKQQFQPPNSSAPHERQNSLQGSCQGASGFPQGFLIRQVLKTKSSSPLVLILVFFAQWLTRRCGICWHPRGLSWQSENLSVLWRVSKAGLELLNGKFAVRVPDYIALSRVNSRHFRSLSKLKRNQVFLESLSCTKDTARSSSVFWGS